MGFWYNTRMPSKYILSRLAHTPFLEPAASKPRLSQEFVDELDVRRQNIALSHDQEAQDWVRQANDALRRGQSKEAKKYVWREFANAQNPLDEPRLFMAGYQWLLDNRELAPSRNKSVLDWQADTSFSSASLLCAASQLPNFDAVQYISQWVQCKQQSLERQKGAPRMLPVQKMRLNDVENEFYNRSQVGYENQVLWEHVLLPALPLLPLDAKQALNVPYLPFFFDHSYAETLLSQAEPCFHAWVLANGLFPGDFVSGKTNVNDENTAIQGLSKFAASVFQPEAKAFLAWDMIHRRDHAIAAAKIVQIHVPHVHGLLSNLGMLQIDAMRQALLTEWHKPSQTLVTLDLPELAMNNA